MNAKMIRFLSQVIIFVVVALMITNGLHGWQIVGLWACCLLSFVSGVYQQERAK